MSNTNLLGRWATGTTTAANPDFQPGADGNTLAGQRMTETPISGEIVFMSPDGSTVKLLGRGSKLVDVKSGTLVVGPAVASGRSPSISTRVTAEGHVVSSAAELPSLRFDHGGGMAGHDND